MAGRAVVARRADVDDLRGEELARVVEGGLDKIERGSCGPRVGGGIVGGIDEAAVAYCGIGEDRGLGVGGEADLRDDADASLCRVSDEMADVGLGIEPACAARRVGGASSGPQGGGVSAERGGGRVGACPCQQGKAWDGEASRRVVGESPVQHVEPVSGHDADE